MKIENIYTSVACNRTPESADWGNNGLIVFGASNSVAIFDPKFAGSAKITKTFVHHTKRVNTAKWIRKTATEVETKFLSGADDGLAILWDVSDENNVQTFVLQGHESGVNAVDAIYVNGKLTVATAAADSTLKLWHFDEAEQKFQCFQTLLLQRGFCFAIRMATLPNSDQILLAYAADDDSISLWTEKASEIGRTFEKVHQLIGHEDWVRGLDFVHHEGDLLLASSAQDNFIRLWRISPRTKDEVEGNKVDVLNIPDGDIHVEERIIQIENCKTNEVECFAVMLESVLFAHEGWVYGVHWNQHETEGLQLLSASIDKTLIVWSPSEDGIWLDKVRVGEVGGNSLGFFGGKFASNGKSIFGHGYQGSFHIWNQSESNTSQWDPNVIVGGHFGEARDLGWEPQGEYLFSVSMDQTTRVHSPWVRENAGQTTWHEIARPQVHGYDMQAIAILSRYKFASGAEEKIVRTFQAPGNFIDNFRRLTGVERDEEGDVLLESLPKGASVPSLGLSNKAVYNCDEPAPEDKHVKDEYPENYFVPVTLSSPPEEETLMQNSLWPEIQKLYGHGFEIFALAASSDGKLLASTCRASNAEHAQIILWNTKTWKQDQKIAAHQLTVTQMKFSPDNKYLVSVSRDRTWTLFEKDTTTGQFAQIAKTGKSNGIHSRIIWSCDWSHDSKYFVTSSRDGKAIVWTKGEESDASSLNGWKAVDVLELKNQSITAVAFAYDFVGGLGQYVLALGLETGQIEVFKFNGKWEAAGTIDRNCAHHLTVKKLQFRPKKDSLQLASCGEDSLVRIYGITI